MYKCFCLFAVLVFGCTSREFSGSDSSVDSARTSAGSETGNLSENSNVTPIPSEKDSIYGSKRVVIQIVNPEQTRDLGLERAIRAEVLNGKGSNTRYIYSRADLNDDGIPETLVYIFGNTEICGSGGCRALVFQQVEKSYSLLARFGPARTPAILAEKAVTSV